MAKKVITIGNLLNKGLIKKTTKVGVVTTRDLKALKLKLLKNNSYYIFDPNMPAYYIYLFEISFLLELFLSLY